MPNVGESTIVAKAGEGGRLFGAVTGKEIADALSKQHGITINKAKLVLDEPIKACGGYKIKAKLGYEVTGSDLSETMLERCRNKAEERGLKVELYQSDFREVDQNVPGTYDCVMSTGNSLPYVSNEDVVLTLGKMDKLVKPGGYLYVDLRNWDKVVEEKQQYYFYRPMFHGDLRVDTIQFWEHHADGTITFHIVFTLEKEGKVIQREVFQERYNPIRRSLVEDTICSLGYDIVRLENMPVQVDLPVDDFDWYCILAKKK